MLLYMMEYRSVYIAEGNVMAHVAQIGVYLNG